MCLVCWQNVAPYTDACGPQNSISISNTQERKSSHHFFGLVIIVTGHYPRENVSGLERCELFNESASSWRRKEKNILINHEWWNVGFIKYKGIDVHKDIEIILPLLSFPVPGPRMAELYLQFLTSNSV
jgi:hypothetical protein